MTREEYNTCVDLHADGLYRFLLKGTQNSEKARDLVQDSYETLWRNHTMVEASKAKSYLFTTAYRRMIDDIRRNGRMERMENGNGNGETQQYSDLNEALHAAVDRLPQDQKAVVLLRDYEGYSYEEIGEITGLSKSQVKVYIYRARLYLRNYIGSPETII